MAPPAAEAPVRGQGSRQSAAARPSSGPACGADDLLPGVPAGLSTPTGRVDASVAHRGGETVEHDAEMPVEPFVTVVAEVAGRLGQRRIVAQPRVALGE